MCLKADYAMRENDQFHRKITQEPYGLRTYNLQGTIFI